MEIIEGSTMLFMHLARLFHALEMSHFPMSCQTWDWRVSSWLRRSVTRTFDKYDKLINFLIMLFSLFSEWYCLQVVKAFKRLKSLFYILVNFVKWKRCWTNFKRRVQIMFTLLSTRLAKTPRNAKEETCGHPFAVTTHSRVNGASGHSPETPHNPRLIYCDPARPCVVVSRKCRRKDRGTRVIDTVVVTSMARGPSKRRAGLPTAAP